MTNEDEMFAALAFGETSGAIGSVAIVDGPTCVVCAEAEATPTVAAVAVYCSEGCHVKVFPVCDGHRSKVRAWLADHPNVREGRPETEAQRRCDA